MDSVSRQLLASGGSKMAAKLLTFNGATNAGTDYQVLLRVGESSGASGSDFFITTSNFPTATSLGDVTFVSATNQTYPAWVEQVTGTAPNRTAWIWVKVLADLSSSQSFYIKYGSGQTQQTPNGNDVFLLFDDFSGSSLDTGKWSTQRPANTSLSSGELSTTGGGAEAWVRSASTFGDHTELVGRVYPANTALHYVGLWGFVNSYGFLNRWENQSVSGVWVGSTNNDLAAKFASTYYRMQIRRSGGNGSLIIDGVLRDSRTGVSTDNQTVVISQTYDNGSLHKVDWVGVKKYRTTEPSFSSASAEMFI